MNRRDDAAVKGPRAPAHDLGAEEALLGAMLLRTEAILDVLGLVEETDFYKPTHGAIFQAVVDLEAEGTTVDPVTVHDRLVATGRADGVEGADLLRLQATCPQPAAARYYAQIVAEHARKRRLGGAGAELANDALDPMLTSEEVLSRAETRVLEAVTERAERRGPLAAAEVGASVLARMEAAQAGPGAAGIATGWSDLDRLLVIEPGALVVVAGRSGMGKTAALTGIALYNAEHDVPTYFCSLEMTGEEIGRRCISQLAHVPEEAIKAGRVDAVMRTRLVAAHERFGMLPLAIDERSSLPPAAIRLAARGFGTRHGLGLVVVDYLQLISGDRRERREVEVREIAEALKALAKDLGVVVAAGAQINRAPEARQDKRPMLSDLRESGGIEQAADVVIGLYRADYYDASSPEAGTAELIVLKNRSGRRGTVRVAWLASFARFADLGHCSPGALR